MARLHSHTGIDYEFNSEGERLYTGLAELQENEYAACPYCKEEKVSYAPDGVDYCQDCEVCIEGETIIWTWKEWDSQA